MQSIYVPMNGETGPSTGPNGKLQTRRIKSAITKAFGKVAKLTFSPGHYYCSCFIEFNSKNIIYLMTSDYRYFPQQYLVRTAKHNKDYTGGSNFINNGFDYIIKDIKELSSNNMGATYA